MCVCHVLVLCPPRVRPLDRPRPVSSAESKSGREFESLELEKLALINFRITHAVVQLRVQLRYQLR